MSYENYINDAIELVMSESFADDLDLAMLSEAIVNTAHALAHFENVD